MRSQCEGNKLRRVAGGKYVAVSAEHGALITRLCQYAIVVVFPRYQHKGGGGGIKVASSRGCLMNIFVSIHTLNLDGVRVVAFQSPFVGLHGLQVLACCASDGIVGTTTVNVRFVASHHLVIIPDDIVEHITSNGQCCIIRIIGTIHMTVNDSL